MTEAIRRIDVGREASASTLRTGFMQRVRQRAYLVSRGARRPVAPILSVAAIAVVLVAGTTFGLLRFVDEPGPALALALPVLAAGLVFVFVVPVHTLPAIALVVFAIVPTRLIPNDGPFNAIPPIAALMAIWVLRRAILGQASPVAGGPPRETSSFGARYAVYATAILLLAWIVFGTLRAGGGETSIGWSMSFAVSVLLPLLVFDARREVALLRTALLWCGGFLGAYAMVELALGFSPLYGALSALSGVTREFGFSVYRAQASFPHPLFAGAFLTIPAALGIGDWLAEGRRRDLVLGVLAAGGIVATVSRSAILALAIAAVLGAILTPMLGGRGKGRRLGIYALLGVVGGIAVLNFGPLVERSDSIESQLSAGVRERAVDIAIRASEFSGWMGTGPGTSGITGRQYEDLIIENSLLQLLISVGIPGLLCFLAFIAALVLSAVSHRDIGAAMAICAYLAAISGFNSIDALRNMHVLIGLLALLALNAPTRDAPTRAAPPVFVPPARLTAPADLRPQYSAPLRTKGPRS
jgi:hypothetical protein